MNGAMSRGRHDEEHSATRDSVARRTNERTNDSQKHARAHDTPANEKNEEKNDTAQKYIERVAFHHNDRSTRRARYARLKNTSAQIQKSRPPPLAAPFLSLLLTPTPPWTAAWT